MNRFFDRAGQPISIIEWAKLLEDREYLVVQQDALPDGTWVSTVWLGLNHQRGSGPPLVFETMVFASQDERRERDCARYTTEDEARRGHASMMDKWRETAARGGKPG